MCAQVVRDGHALGLFVEGTRQRSGVPGEVKPGAAMVALQERGAGRAGGDSRHAELAPRQLPPVSIAWGKPMRFDGLCRGSEGYREASQEIERRIRAPLGLPRRHARARDRPRADGASPGASPTTSQPVRGPRGTASARVAIVGFPNVGKSTLVNRLTATREAVVHETPGVTRDRKELVCEWSGKRVPARRHGRRRRRRPSPMTQQVAEQARAAIADADLVLFVTDAKAGDHARRRGARRRSCAGRAQPVLLIANKIDDPSRDLEALEFHRLGLGDPIPLSALHGHGTGDLLDSIVERLARHAAAPTGRGGGDSRRDPRPAQRRQVEPPERAAREERVIVSETPGTTRDAIDTVLAPRRPDVRARRHRRPPPQAPPAAGDRVLLGAPRAPGGRAGRRRARARRRERRRSWSRTSPSPTSARKAQCSTLVVLSKWDVATIDVEDTRPEIARRLRQRPPVVAISAQTGRGVSACSTRVEELFDRHARGIADRRAEPLPRRAPRGAPAAVAQRAAAEPAVRHAGSRPPAALPILRQRSGPGHARLRLLGREPAARTLRAPGRSGCRSTSFERA